MLLGLMALLFASALACNLPINLSPNEISPVEDIQPPDLEPTETTVIQVQRETAQAGSSEPTEDTDSGSTPDSPDIAPAPDLTIQPGEAPAIPDCNVFDINAFNTIIDGVFTFVTQDQLNNCHYESDNGFRMLIGGGKPVAVSEIENLFDTSFGHLPDSTWEIYDGFYLGLAYSSVSVTAQGVSNSGHSIVIVVGSQPAADPDALQLIFKNLAQEAASQLNSQWQ